MDLRPADPEQVKRTLWNGLHNPRPKSNLAHALHLKKTIRVGNRSDPYQPAEVEHHITHNILKVLIKFRWTFLIQSRFTNNMMNDLDLLQKAHRRGLIQLLPIITPGMEWDWCVLEKEQTPCIDDRLATIRKWVKMKLSVGVLGEPFIPGLHTPKMFRELLKRLKGIGVHNYNTYNLHLNDHVAKQLASIGLDIEKIWWMNQDAQWRPIHAELCKIAEDVGVLLGCPDFVNTPHSYVARTNTCCGISVPNPSKYNTHHWRRMLLKGKPVKTILKKTWEGIGDREMGEKIVKGEPCKMFTMKDAGLA